MFKVKLIVECENIKTTIEKQLWPNDKWTRERITNTDELTGICYGQFQRMTQKLYDNMKLEPEKLTMPEECEY